MAATTQTIQKMYIAYFGRPADTIGLQYWADKTEAQIIAGFSASSESQALFGNQGSAAKVNAIYNNLFARDAEPAGLQYWVQKLESGQVSQAEAMYTILNNAGAGDATAVANKLAAAEAFTAQIDTTPEILGYSGANAAQSAREWLGKVNANAASLDAAKASAPAALAAAAGASAGDSGKTFTLTQGLDTITGTSGNDTINAFAFNSVTGANTTTLQSVDTIDGGAGTDTLNIEVKDPDTTTAASTDFNDVIQGTIKNVEIININNTAAETAAAVDASKFVGATAINQIAKAAAVTNLAVGTTAGFNGTSSAVSVTAAATAASASVALASVVETASSVAISGAALNAVNVTGTVVDGVDAGTDVASLAVGVTVGTDVQTVSVNTAVATTLTVADANAATKNVTAVDASASTGAVTYAGLVTDTSAATTYAAQSVKTGAGNDVVSLVTATLAAATGVTAVAGSVSTGAGNDQITVTTTGSGETVVDAGAGDDQVSITGRGTGKLTVNLGEGNDRFSTTGVAINGTDVIDAGAGSDTLSLSLVGSANIGAFSNFDAFDVAGMAKTLDVDILAAKNTVSEFVGSATAGAAAALTNVGAGVNFRATGDMGTANTLTLTQKTAGALTVTLDADETGVADIAVDTASAAISATNATSLKAVFDTAYLASITGETAAGDNVSTLNLSGVASTLSVVSGGANASNVLVYDDIAPAVGAGAEDALTSVTVSGDRALNLDFTTSTKLATVDASALTGGLTFSLVDLKNGGNVTLGSGKDVITVTSSSTGADATTGAAAFEKVTGFEKTAAVSVSTVAAEATAKAAAIADADVLVLAGATVANDVAAGAIAGGTVTKGVLTFTGAGPSDLTAAIAIADAAADTAGEAVAFEFLGNTYAFVQDGVTDTLVQLVGITGVTNFAEGTTTDNFFIV